MAYNYPVQPFKKILHFPIVALSDKYKSQRIMW